MRLEDYYFLLTPDGQKLLSQLAKTPIRPENHLPVITQIRRQLPKERAHAVLETVILRQRAVTKFNQAGGMYFTREALQQASAEVVSAYRARRYLTAGFNRVADLACGIGGDALSLATYIHVIGVDWNPLRLAMAQENVRLYGNSHRFHPLQADLEELSPLSVEALFFDPSRRDQHGRRLYSVEDYRPPLSFLKSWREQVPNQGAKIGPGVNYSQIPSEAEVEFISVKGEVREAVLWFGELRTSAGRRATLLPGEHTLIDEPIEPVLPTAPKRYLYEPDGAVIRAHLVEQLANRLGANKIDLDIAYLTSDQPKATPFARCFILEDAFPFQLKRLRHYLRKRRIGRVTIKKRGSPLEPDVLRQRLRLVGDEHRIVFLTRVLGEPTVLIGQAHGDRS